MTENADSTKFDFLCEKKLHQTDEALYTRFRSSVFAVDALLAGYKNIFPFLRITPLSIPNRSSTTATLSPERRSLTPSIPTRSTFF